MGWLPFRPCQPPLVQEAADQSVGAPLDDLDNRPFGLAAVFASRLDQHAVPMQDLEHFARGKEDVLTTAIPDEKTEPVAVTLHATGDEIKLVGEQQHAFAVWQQLAVALHGGKATVKAHLRLLAGNAHTGRKIFGGKRCARGAQRLENLLARRYVGIVVGRQIGGCGGLSTGLLILCGAICQSSKLVYNAQLLCSFKLVA